MAIAAARARILDAKPAAREIRAEVAADVALEPSESGLGRLAIEMVLANTLESARRASRRG